MELDMIEAASEAPRRFFLTIDAEPEELLPTV
jgi:hypothetical protein